MAKIIPSGETRFFRLHKGRKVLKPGFRFGKGGRIITVKKK